MNKDMKKLGRKLIVKWMNWISHVTTILLWKHANDKNK